MNERLLFIDSLITIVNFLRLEMPPDFLYIHWFRHRHGAAVGKRFNGKLIGI